MKMIAIPGKNYSIGETTVTQGQWKRIMGTEPWKGQLYVREGNDHPAVYVNWKDAVEFCEKLSKKEGRTYRLPTEAEWEYACSGGTTTKYHFGDDTTKLGDYAWFDRNALFANKGYANRVAEKLPNQFGLYDMHGNVWEWCSDWYNPKQIYRVLRGGSWLNISDFCSTWFRSYDTQVSRDDVIGFRLAR